ncbi:hypothetical protein GMES_3403 [Paraglaciecola mesophila KMM 241]|uniref:Transmembrane protein n=1 Tax=Paraglaciecola mesophila KMM 241 TaxID=1128912 RepID=K6ZQS2_9ALTE|nr:DUF924 family protein [Paraglaciecola mesophila]GAC25680.1 hypothetical protein GMES_3403 [Paraglaciecola mesophila KMM 241]
MTYKDIIQFWFNELTPSQWWQKSAAFDADLKERFFDVHQQAIHCELSHWRACALGRLAEIIVIDQFSRNIYRDTAKAFCYDPLVLALAQEAVAVKADDALSESQRNFMYMPFMHSESLLIHQQARSLFENKASQHTFDFELKHMAIIQRFGRYPHRNDILQRSSSKEERVFLTEPNSGF